MTADKPPKKPPFSDPEFAKKASALGHEERRERTGKAMRLIAEAGVSEDEITDTLIELAKKAIKGSAADMRLFLQQTGQLTKGPEKDWDGQSNCPTCGLDPAGGLVITADDVKAVIRAVERLDEIVGATDVALLDSGAEKVEPE